MMDLRGRVRVLEELPDLGAGLPPEEVDAATRTAVAPVLALEPGVYRPAIFDRYADQLGLLVLDGLLIRRVAVAGRHCGELIGPGAVLRPWDHHGEIAPLPFDIRWRVLEPTRLAVLSVGFLRLGVRWPMLVQNVFERMSERTHSLAFNVAIHCLHHVSVRLLVLLWHLADGFGKVTPAGTSVPLALTHRDLAELTGALRPSVSTALGELRSRNLVVRAPDRTWLLLGDPPTELRDLRQHRDTA
jgi:CRP/FNR family transcriptional regulator, cyclic AMP receptor protein